ncbi:MAG: MarC family protein [Planctomycetota bacterium]
MLEFRRLESTFGVTLQAGDSANAGPALAGVETAERRCSMERLVGDFLTFLTTVDPIGTLTIFVGLTAAATPQQRVRIAWRAVAYSALILILFILLGQFFLGSVGIQLASFQIAGGVIFFLFGLQMVFGAGASTSSSEGDDEHDVAVFPLAVPSIASPGAILAAVVLTDNREFSIAEQALTAGLLLAVLGITLVAMLQANRLFHLLGKAGCNLVIRVMGMILCGLAVEMVLAAIAELAPGSMAA